MALITGTIIGKLDITIYIPSIVNQSLAKALKPKNIKFGFLTFNTDILLTSFFTSPIVIDFPLQQNET